MLMKLLNDNPAPALAKVLINTLGRLASSEEVCLSCACCRLVMLAVAWLVMLAVAWLCLLSLSYACCRLVMLAVS